MASVEQLDELMGLLDGAVKLRDGHGHEIALGADVAEAFQMAVAEMLTHDVRDLTTEEAAKLIARALDRTSAQ